MLCDQEWTSGLIAPIQLCLHILQIFGDFQQCKASEIMASPNALTVFVRIHQYGRTIGKKIHPLYITPYSFAIHLVRSGFDLQRVQQLLGHSNPNTTQVYLRFNDQDLREEYNKIEF
jgi:site-specific recombinase XerD